MKVPFLSIRFCALFFYMFIFIYSAYIALYSNAYQFYFFAFIDNFILEHAQDIVDYLHVIVTAVVIKLFKFQNAYSSNRMPKY